EIGIRMAIGSSAADVFRMVLGEGARLVAVGLVLGLAGSIALSRLVRSMLYDVAPTDPLVYVVVLVLLSLTAMVASVVPARRAMRFHPLVPMRAACRAARLTGPAFTLLKGPIQLGGNGTIAT